MLRLWPVRPWSPTSGLPWVIVCSLRQRQSCPAEVEILATGRCWVGCVSLPPVDYHRALYALTHCGCLPLRFLLYQLFAFSPIPGLSFLSLTPHIPYECAPIPIPILTLSPLPFYLSPPPTPSSHLIFNLLLHCLCTYTKPTTSHQPHLYSISPTHHLPAYTYLLPTYLTSLLPLPPLPSPAT
ncbi:hypothetical protein GGR57DRAFT_81529 [Xylariaceae sp. FL1272]|nr:hypothetical protein GGR57DRAFT_81529 [Xylariaceae sp. FL1272]